MANPGENPGLQGTMQGTKTRDGRYSVRRFFWLPLGLSGVLVVLLLLMLVSVSWRGLDRLRPVLAHHTHISRIQAVTVHVERAVLHELRGITTNRDELQKISGELIAVASLEETLHPDADHRLKEIGLRLGQQAPVSAEVLFNALTQLQEILADERAGHDQLLVNVTDSMRTELRLALALLVILPTGGIIAVYLLRRRMEQPLRDLQDLLDRLARRDLRPLPERVLGETTGPARPAFDSYNALVMRLQDLEAEHLDRERLLERRVREATEALLAQSRELARAERLAAVGAVSAGFAHELRNPLAGIQLACSRLQQQLGDSEQSQRISAVIAELRRINQLLTEQVDAARHEPEPLVPTNMAATVTDLLGLLRYQVPQGFLLESDVEDDVDCLLPPDALRQALLNLVLNAVQIQGEAGRVVVSARREADQVVIRVLDDGPGFPEEMLRTGVRPFATGRAGGTGLGLAMVRRFVRDNDGDLVIENRSPHGAQVTLRLPCRLASEPGMETDA